jgi:hypothetical protein
MSKARAELTLEQVQNLLSGRPITIRVPQQRIAAAFAVAQPTGKADVTHIVPEIEVEITREPLHGKVITCTVTNIRRATRIDRVFNHFCDLFRRFDKWFDDFDDFTDFGSRK